jgi:hypothetical protein
MTSEAIKANFNFDSESHPYEKPTNKIKDPMHVQMF